MRRREGESILIGQDIEIRILAINGSRVKIGIEAPRSIPVLAREAELVRTENLAAARVPAGAAAAIVAKLLNQGWIEKKSDVPGQTAEMRHEV